MSQIYMGAQLPPGQLPAIETLEPRLTSIVWGPWGRQVIGHNVFIAADQVDAGNTGFTTHLRAGLLLGRISEISYKVWDPTASDGSQFIDAILMHSISTTYMGSTQPRWTGYVLRAGQIKAKGIVVPGSTDEGIVGNANEFEIRRQLSTRFLFDDMVVPYTGAGSTGDVTKTANYTVLESDYGKAFNTLGAAGAVNFTLPATPKRGLEFSFKALANQNMVITGAAGNIIAFNNLAATTLTFSTANQIIGAEMVVRGNGTKWVASNRSFNGQTLTVA